jgi:hypothetical protein
MKVGTSMATKKTTKTAAKKTTKKMADKTKTKIARRTKAKGRKSRRLTGQQRQSLQRLDPLTKKYQAEGMSPEDARQRAYDELRNNPSQDWGEG